MMVKETGSEKETFEFAKKMGEEAAPGDIIALTGDLGTGKTVFAKGFAEGLGVKERVNSPTYTIMQQYDDGRMPFYHFDVYRIGDISEMDETGYEDCFFGNGVTLVEWADLIKELMPENTVWIEMRKDNSRGFDHRMISIKSGENK